MQRNVDIGVSQTHRDGIRGERYVERRQQRYRHGINRAGKLLRFVWETSRYIEVFVMYILYILLLYVNLAFDSNGVTRR
jgi:hypothetical protein